MEFDSDSFTFDISIVRCLGGYFFRTQLVHVGLELLLETLIS